VIVARTDVQEVRGVSIHAPDLESDVDLVACGEPKIQSVQDKGRRGSGALGGGPNPVIDDDAGRTRPSLVEQRRN
jgi:hypothetical protein